MTGKPKVLWVGDYNVATGFGEITENILHNLTPNKYEIHVLACNYNGIRPIYPAEFPVWGCRSSYALDEIAMVFDKVQPDILITMQDGFVLPMYHQKLGKRVDKCYWIAYPFVDGPEMEKWGRTLNYVNKIVVPTGYQQDLIKNYEPTKNLETEIVPPGVDGKIYYPFYEQLVTMYKKSMFGEKNENAYVFGMVAKNFQRKRYPELIQAFSFFLRKHEDIMDRPAILVVYPTGQENACYSLANVAKNCGLNDENFFIVRPEAGILADSEMNELYNCFDCNCVISIGEGYGMPLNYAAMLGKPSIVVNNSVMPYLAKFLKLYVTDPLKQITYFEHDFEQERHLPDIEKLTDAMYMTYKFERKPRPALTQYMVENMLWHKIVKEWERIIDEGITAIERDWVII